MKLLDNFLSKETYLEILDIAQSDSGWVLVDKEGTASKYEMQLPEYLTEAIKEQYRRKIINLTEFGIDPENFRVGIIKCEPGYWYPLHADHYSKLISAVVYLSPKQAPATIFQDEQSPRWRVNRLVAWKNDGQVHWYKNDTQEDRYTLNIYQTKGDVNFVVDEG